MTDTHTREESIAIARTIAAQIPNWLKGAVGYRNPIALDSGLQFDVRGRGPYRVTVVYDRGWDLYNVSVTTKSRAPRVFYEADQLDVEQMVEIIDNIDRGRLSA